MGRRGPKGDPDDVQAFKGNPNRKKLFVEDYIVPTQPLPDVDIPDFLTYERERELFKRVVNDFIHRRIARPADVSAFARWAVYLNRWMAAKEFMDGKHTFYKSVTHAGERFVPAPQWKDMLDLERCICSLEDRLGLNPVARQSIIRGLSTMPTDLGGIELRKKGAKDPAPQTEPPAPVSPIGFGKLN